MERNSNIKMNESPHTTSVKKDDQFITDLLLIADPQNIFLLLLLSQVNSEESKACK